MKILTRFAIVFSAATVLFFGTANAAAMKTFDFTFSTANGSGSGTLTATLDMDGTYTAISGSGTEDYLGQTSSFSLYVNPNGSSTSDYYFPNGASYYFDNKLYVSSSVKLDEGGLLFLSTATDHNTLNLFYVPAGQYNYLNAALPGIFSNHLPASFTLTEQAVQQAVPEPESLALLGVGCFGLGIARRKSHRISY
jgi:hypothetical protein